MTKTRVLIAQPGYGVFEPESYQAAARASERGRGVDVTVLRTRSSLLAHNFNDAVAVALNNNYHYFAMLHTDISADEHWLDVLLAELEAGEYDVIHAPVAIKDARGITSTAIAYADSGWVLNRRITTSELQTLPETFDADILRSEFDSDTKHLLPNTGCLLMRADTWLRDFPGFEIKDRIRRHENGVYLSEVVPEDWNFGLWCGTHGLRVAGTRKVITHHYGRADFGSHISWGQSADEFWTERTQPQEAIKC